jgi:ATP-dependent Clp protease ATP-binding subunit ClpA
MFERLTDDARAVLVLAEDEARASGQSMIGSEHLLLGMLDEGRGFAAQALARLGLSADDVRAELRILHPWLTGDRVKGPVPFTPRARAAVERAALESARLSQDHVGTEHLLMGLVAGNNGLAVTILNTFDVDSPAVLSALEQLIATHADAARKRRERRSAQAAVLIRDWFFATPTQPVRRLVVTAAGVAGMASHPQIEVDDLVAALTSYVNDATLSDLGVDPEQLRTAVERRAQRHRLSARHSDAVNPREQESPDRGAIGIDPSTRLRRMLNAASALAIERGQVVTEFSDVLLALTRDEQTAATLRDLGVDTHLLSTTIKHRYFAEQPPSP